MDIEIYNKSMKMREIKFRGKRVDNKKWIFGYFVKYLNPNDYYIFDDGVSHQVDFETIGQFTGLTDRDGKEIYEGDIIKVNTWYYNLVPFDYEYKYEEEKGYATYLVKWDDRSCEFYLEYINHTKIEPRCKVLKIHRAQEVIGCIHD